MFFFATGSVPYWIIIKKTIDPGNQINFQIFSIKNIYELKKNLVVLGVPGNTVEAFI